MAKRTYSAKGEVVDFDLISITQALASQPAPVNVNARRQFIDEKEKNKVIRAVPAAQYKGDLPTSVKETLPKAETEIGAKVKTTEEKKNGSKTAS